MRAGTFAAFRSRDYRLWGGVLADRYPRRRLMISSDVARAACIAVFFALDASGHLTLDAVVLLAVCFGLADGFFQPAFGGILPLVVEQPLLASVNSWISIARNGSRGSGRRSGSRRSSSWSRSPPTPRCCRIVRGHHDRDVGSYGLLFSLMAAGIVAGSLLYARWNPRQHRVATCFGAFGINDVGIVAVAALTPVGFALPGGATAVFSATTVVAVGSAIGLVLWFVPLASRNVRTAA